MYNLFNEESAASRCLGLIERHCAKFMVTGGGSLSPDRKPYVKRGNEMTSEKKARCLELGREGKLTGTEIARAVELPQSSVQMVLSKAGIKVPDGRGAANRRRHLA
jgi:hypothetical protein